MLFSVLALDKINWLEIGGDDIVETKENINGLVQRYLEMNHKNIYPINKKLDYLKAANQSLVNSFFSLIIGVLVFLATW
jgi:hypothetical protein